MSKQDLLLAGLVIALTAALVLGLFSTLAVGTGSWGLSFQTPGEAPVGPAGADQLRALDAVYLGAPGEKRLWLTFDAGYENGCTARILQVLKDHDAPALFFLTGHYIRSQPDLVRQMVAEGHTVGNHTMHHPDMRSLTQPEAFARELEELEELYENTVGQPMEKYYRPPQGLYSRENLELAQSMGYKTVFWSLAHADWNNDAQPDPEQALQKLLGRTHDGAVVLLHATSRTNARILDALLTRWEQQGYRIASPEELFTPGQ